MSVVKLKPKLSLRPIRKKENTQKSQWQLKVKTTKLPEGRENTRGQVVIGFSFASDWLRKRRAKEVKQNLSIPGLLSTLNVAPMDQRFSKSQQERLMFKKLFYNDTRIIFTQLQVPVFHSAATNQIFQASFYDLQFWTIVLNLIVISRFQMSIHKKWYMQFN